MSQLHMSYLDPSREIRKHGQELPHWQQGDAMQFVTFRLADSLPTAQLRLWREQRNNWLAVHPKPWTASEDRDYQKRFIAHLEELLDQGAGSCLLKETGNRHSLEEALMAHQGRKVEHHAWVIMPNHVHLIFTPLQPMEKLIQVWKGVSARKMGHGRIWQKNYRDTMIRDGEHFANAVRYIRRNPVKLRAGTFTLWEGEKARAVK
jgi:putative transposase